MKLIKKFFTNLWNLTLTSKTINVIKSTWIYLKEYDLISDTLYSEAFAKVLRTYLHLNVKRDWLGRLYGVVNPSIDIDGNLNPSTMIIEIDGENSNNNEQVKYWAYKQMQLISDLFKINQLYDYIKMDFEHIGPEELDNYLITIDMAARADLATSLKSWCKQTILYIIIAVVIAMIILL